MILDKHSMSEMLGMDLSDEAYEKMVEYQKQQLENAKKEVSSRFPVSKVKVSDLEAFLESKLFDYQTGNHNVVLNISALSDLYLGYSSDLVDEIKNGSLWSNADKEVTDRILLSKIKNLSKLITVNNKKEKEEKDPKEEETAFKTPSNPLNF